MKKRLHESETWFYGTTLKILRIELNWSNEEVLKRLKDPFYWKSETVENSVIHKKERRFGEFSTRRAYWMKEGERVTASYLPNEFVWLDDKAGTKWNNKESKVV